MKKIIALLLSLLTFFSLVGCDNHTRIDDKKDSYNSESPIEDFEYENTDGGIKITKYLGEDKKVVIPETIENKKVVSIDSTVFEGNVVLESIVLPKYFVGSCDMNGCDNLVYLEFKGNDTHIFTDAPIKTIIAKETKQVFICGRQHNTCIHYCLDSLEKLIIPKCEEFSIMFNINQHPWKSFEKIKEIELHENTKYYSISKNDMWGSDAYEITISIKAEDENYKLITDENRAIVYCSIFNKDNITVNGVTYECTERLWD